MRNLSLLVAFSILAPAVLVWSLTTLSKPPSATAYGEFISAEPQPAILGVGIFGAVPASSGEISTHLVPADAREIILRDYLAYYQSPLLDFAPQLVAASDKYRLDFRLLVAIAQQESNLCKLIPEGSHNCWGWGIHQSGTLGFASYPEAIETVSAGLRSRYLDQGLTTPEQIMSKYTPASPGSWAAGVQQFLAEME